MRIDGDPEVSFHVFDHIEEGDDLPYLSRLQVVRDYPCHEMTDVWVVDQRIIRTADQLLEYEQTTLKQGFEGVMLRRP